MSESKNKVEEAYNKIAKIFEEYELYGSLHLMHKECPDIVIETFPIGQCEFCQHNVFKMLSEVCMKEGLAKHGPGSYEKHQKTKHVPN